MRPLVLLIYAAKFVCGHLFHPLSLSSAYVHTALKPLLPALLLRKKVAKLLRNVLHLVAQHIYVHRENLSKPRKPGPKPHKYNTQKHC